MATSGSFATNAYNSKKWIELHWSRSSYDLGNNTTTIYYEVRGCGTTTSYHMAAPITVVIDGETVYSVTTRFQLYKDTVLKSGYKTITHNNDGTRSFSASVSAAIYSAAVNCTGSGSWTLDSLPRQATLTAAPNFNDEQNPTITYSNPAGNSVSSLQACISLTGAQADVPYRDISKTGTSYTFTLSDTERATLRNATPNSNSLSVTFFVRTAIGGNTFHSTIQRTMTITNGNPTLSPTVVDSNATTKALTGDANKLVKYYSNAAYTIGASAKKGASLSSQKVTHNGSTKTTATGTYNAVEGASFAFEAKDSRGNVSTKTVTKTLINYVKLTCNQKVRITVDGTATISVNGNYFNGSFGAVANTLTVQYRYKTSGGTYSSWTAITATKSGNTYTATATKTGLNYKTTYVFQCRAVDKLATIPTAEQNFKALPVFDWGENDFKFNVPVTFGAGFTQATAIGGDDLEDEVIYTGDYVIEEGDNGSYAYRKWNSGLMEAWRTSQSALSVTSSETYGSTYYTTQHNLTTVGSASQFTTVQNVQVTVNKNGSMGFWQPVLNKWTLSEGAVTVNVFFTNPAKDATVTVIPYVYIIGRWK